MGPQIQNVQQGGTSEIVGQVHTAYSSVHSRSYCRVRCGSVGHTVGQAVGHYGVEQ